jgi:phage head maturation protease
MKSELNLPVLTRAAELLPASFNEEARTVEVIWSTGARVRRYGFFDTYDEELSLDPGAVRLERLNAGGPFLADHKASVGSVLGSVVPGSVAIEKGRAVAAIRLTDREDAAGIVGDIRAGHIKAVSVGYRVHKYEITENDSGPDLYRAVDWEPLEISAVPLGADPGAGFRSAEAVNPCIVIRADAPKAAATAATKEADMADENARAETTDGAEVQNANQNGSVPETRRDNVSAVDPAIADQVRAQEQERITTITGLVDRFKLERSLADDLIKRNVSVADARKVILDKLAERDARGIGHSQVSMPAGGLDATVTRREALAEAILHRAQPQAFPMTDRAREYRGMRLIDVARDCLETAGVRTRGMTPNEIAYTATRSSGLQSTSDFPLILAAVAGKRLRQAYAGTPRTFVMWARGVTATDFKPMYPTQVGNFPALKPVMEGAEFSYGSIAEGRESYQLATYGRIVALTRQAIVNDDLRAFDRALGTAGQRAADLESAIVYNVLLANANLADGTALFHANHGNVGTAGVISETSWSEAWEKMTQQKDLGDATGADKEYIDARPRFALVPPGQRAIEARKMIAATTPAKSADVNPFTGALQVIEEPRLFKTGGPQPWYLAADPNLVDTVEYAHLEGQTEPFLDQRAGFEVDGVEIKIRHDFAAKALDFRGLFYNAGV